MNHEKPIIRLWSPLFPKLCRSNGGGYSSEEMTILDSDQLIPYQEEIMAAIEGERFPGEGDRGLAVYLNEEHLQKKVYSIIPSVEEWNDDLWGVTEVLLSAELEPDELADLMEEVAGQFSDGWGEGMKHHPINILGGQMYLSFWDASDAFFLKTEDEMMN